MLPRETVRIIGVAVGFWGLTWMVGLLASLRVHPHVVSDSGLRIRYGTTVDIVQLDRAESRVVVQIGILSQTNVDVELRRPMAIPLPKGDGEPIHEVCASSPPTHGPSLAVHDGT